MNVSGFRKNIVLAVIGLIVLGTMAMGVLMVLSGTDTAAVPAVPTQQIWHIRGFIDMNADGLDDNVVDSQVILNQGAQILELVTPTPGAPLP